MDQIEIYDVSVYNIYIYRYRYRYRYRYHIHTYGGKYNILGFWRSLKIMRVLASTMD